AAPPSGILHASAVWLGVEHAHGARDRGLRARSEHVGAIDRAMPLDGIPIAETLVPCAQLDALCRPPGAPSLPDHACSVLMTKQLRLIEPGLLIVPIKYIDTRGNIQRGHMSPVQTQVGCRMLPRDTQTVPRPLDSNSF